MGWFVGLLFCGKLAAEQDAEIDLHPVRTGAVPGAIQSAIAFAGVNLEVRRIDAPAKIEPQLTLDRAAALPAVEVHPHLHFADVGHVGEFNKLQVEPTAGADVSVKPALRWSQR